MSSLVCDRFRDHMIARFTCLYGTESLRVGEMKSKPGKYRLSPNEEAELIKAETEKRKKLRLLQVREQSRINAAKVRQAVKQEKERQLSKLATDVENQLEKERQEKLRLLEAQYENTLRTIGQGHKQAGEQYSQEDLRNALLVEDNRRARERHKAALERQQSEAAQRNYEKNKHIISRKTALELEKERALKIASLPPPPPDPLLQLDLNGKNQVKLTDVNAFSTTRYHMIEDYGVDRADSGQQGDAKKDAEEEAERMLEKQMELDRLRTEQLERARLRHKHALGKELLKNDYEKMVLELSDMQRADRDRRQKVVANIPKQVFEPPHRRMEVAREKQNDMEQAFEDMYMATTDFTGDLSLALDRHPPPETPSVTESLEASVLSELDSLQEPTLSQVPAVLKDLTNTTKHGQPSPTKKPEKVLRKLMNKIKSQRTDWASRSVLDNPELNQPLGDGPEMMIPVRDDDFPVKDIPIQYSGMNTHKTSQSDPRTASEFPTFQDGFPRQQQAPATYQPQPPSYRQPPHSPPEKLTREGEELDGSLLESAANLRTAQPEHGYTLLHPMEIAAKLRGQLVPEQVSLEVLNGDKDEGKTAAEIGSLLEQQKQIEEQKRQLEGKLHELLRQQKTVHQTNPAIVQSPGVQNGIPSTLLQRTGFSNGIPHTHIQPPNISNGVPHAIFQHSTMPNGMPPMVSQHSASPTTTMGYLQHSQHPMGSPQFQHTQFLPPTLQHQMAAPSNPAFTFVTAHTSVHGIPAMQMAAPAQHSQHFFSKDQIPNYAVNGVVPSQRQTTWPGVPSPGTMATTNKHTDHMRKIKEYQQQLLARHEHSKKVLADTRNEIEKRRKELLQRFPQLSGMDRSQSFHHQEIMSTIQIPQVGFQPAQMFGQVVGQTHGPAVAEAGGLPGYTHYINTATSHFQSQPQQVHNYPPQIDHSQFFDSRLLTDELIGQTLETGGSKSDSVRKSLSFDADDSYMKSPLYPDYKYAATTPHSDARLKPVVDEEEAETTISSSERGSPFLPPHKNFSSSDSEQDLSLVRMAKERCETFEKKKKELQSQLDVIQKQKDDILNRHELSQIRIKMEKDRLKSKLIRAVAESQHEKLTADLHELDEESETSDEVIETTTEEESDAIKSTSPHSEDTIQPTVPQPSDPDQSLPHPPTKSAYLVDHIPHELSTIAEVETPASDRASGRFSSGHGNLSSSESSARSRGSLEFSQSLPMVPEVQYSPDVIQKVAADTGYQSSEIEEILRKAKEFDASMLKRFRQQTNDVLDSINPLDESAGHVTLSTRSLTPESSIDSTPISRVSQNQPPSEQPTSIQQQSEVNLVSQVKPVETPRWAEMLIGEDRPSDSSTLSSKSWADEFSNYKDKNKEESVFSQNLGHDSKPVEKESQPHIAYSLNTPSNIRQNNANRGTEINGRQISGLKNVDVLDPVSSGVAGEQFSGYASGADNLPGTVNIDLSRYSVGKASKQLDEILGAEFSDMPSSENRIADPMQDSISEKSEVGDLSQYPISDTTKSPELLQYPMSEEGKSDPGDSEPSVDNHSNFLPLQSDHDDSLTRDRLSVERTEDLLIDFSTPKVSQTKRGHEVSNTLKENREFPLDLTKHSFSLGNDHMEKSTIFRSEAQTMPISSSETSSAWTGSSETSGSIRDAGSLPMPIDREQISGLSAAQSSLHYQNPNISSTLGVKSFTSSLDRLGGTDLSSATTDFNISGVAHLRSGSELSNVSELSGDDSSAQTSSHAGHSINSANFDNLFKRTSQSDLDLDPRETSILSSYTILSDAETEDDSYVDKKFANLDKLLQESKDLIARHREVVDKNKKREWEDNQKKNEEILDSAEFVHSARFEGSGFYSARVEDSQSMEIGLTDKTDNLMSFDEDSLNLDGSKHEQPSMDFSEGPLSSYSLSQILENETGISDEPDLTLVTLDSEVSITEDLGQPKESVTNGDVHSTASSGDSLMSFEQLEKDIDKSDRSTEARRSPPDAGISMDEAIFTKNFNNSAVDTSVPNVDQEQLLSNLYRAVPVVINVPKLSMTMQVDSNRKAPQKKMDAPKPVAGRPTNLHIETPSEEDSTSSWTSMSDKAFSPQIPGSPTRIGNFKGLNKALQPRMSGRGMAGLGITRHTEFGKKIHQFENPTQTSPSSEPTKQVAVQQKPVSSPHRPVAVFTKTVSEPKRPVAETQKLDSIPTKTAKPMPAEPAQKRSITSTLSSWKKSRGIKKEPPPVPPKNLTSGVRVLPTDPPPQTKNDEKSEAAKNQAYEKKMRAYNPRLFRLCNRLEEGDEEEGKAKDKDDKGKNERTEKQKQHAANREKVKDFQKKLQENMKRRQQQKK
ncbi:hypothetical protein ScPMuIL_018124 [Solemya velum]